MVKLEKPQIISLFYKPEPDSPNRGSCEWARFYFDLKNYTLSIESDCGNYSYGWIPTPRTESFLQLCARFEADYLLCKISNESVVDGDETFELIKELVKEVSEVHECDDLNPYNWECLERACCSYCDAYATYDAINAALRYTDLEDLYESYEIQERIVITYPTNAKKIAEIFCGEIQPYIKANLKELELEA